MKNTEVIATANQSKRTFTIRKKDSKYRTLPLTKDEFRDMEMNTSDDWKEFLRREQYLTIN